MPAASPAMDQNNQGPPSPFHCSLLAPTAITTKINEETLTYLNQGKLLVNIFLILILFEILYTFICVYFLILKFCVLLQILEVVYSFLSHACYIHANILIYS